MSALPQDFNRDIRSSRSRRKLVSRTVPIAATNTVVLEARSNTSIDAIVASNSSSGNLSIRIFHVWPDESAGYGNALIYDAVIRANSAYVVPHPVYMTAGDRLIAYASTAAVLGVTVYGVEG